VGTYAVCWDGKTYFNTWEHPFPYPWCIYKNYHGSACTGGTNPGLIYKCEASSRSPSALPTVTPTLAQTSLSPTAVPSVAPTRAQTSLSPTAVPSVAPTRAQTSLSPTAVPSATPTVSPFSDDYGTSCQKIFSSVYKKQTVRIASFFKSAGTQVKHHHRPSLRTETVSGYNHATVHFTYYKDAACTEAVFYNDYKINRCTRDLGFVTLEAASHSTWTLHFQENDDEDCIVPTGDPFILVAKKNHCYKEDDFDLFFTVNIMGEPRKAIPHGGNALVYYDNEHDCAVSKHENLARAVFVVSWPMNVCSFDSDWRYDWKATSCDSGVMTFSNFQSQGWTCNRNERNVLFTKSCDSCTTGVSDSDYPVRFRCLADSSSS
jgi:hypothetical protein